MPEEELVPAQEYEEEPPVEPEDPYEEEVEASQIDAILRKNQEYEDKLRMSQNLAASAPERDSNFLHVQISTEELLKKLENFYRGRYETVENGNIVYKEPEDKSLITLNDFGVASMMEIISRYIDKNTTLSSYREERIYEIIADIGEDLILFLLSNYKKMGLNTYEKKTKFRILITTTCHIIESAYRRALGAETLKKLNESKAIHQFDTNEAPRAQSKKENWIQRTFR